MKKKQRLSIKIIRKVVFILVVLVGILTVGVIASKSDITYVTISFSDNSEITVMTNKIKVSDILEENHIILLPNEFVYPSRDSNIDITKKIIISEKVIEDKIVAKDVKSVTKEEILGNYLTITEKIIIEQIEIPYETITKDVSASDGEKTDKVIQNGENGLKEVKYKAKFQENEEIERTIISEKVIKEPIDKIIQISTRVTSRSGVRTFESPSSLPASVEGKTPTVVTLNASAYAASTCDKEPGHTLWGITASGATATAYYTVAAGKGIPMGTVIYIPYFADSPNSGWFVVQDRGGAITDAKIDIFFDTELECKNFGRRNLECYIYY